MNGCDSPGSKNWRELRDPFSYQEVVVESIDRGALIDDCNLGIETLQSVLNLLSEKDLNTVKNQLNELFQELTLQVEVEESNEPLRKINKSDEALRKKQKLLSIKNGENILTLANCERNIDHANTPVNATVQQSVNNYAFVDIPCAPNFVATDVVITSVISEPKKRQYKVPRHKKLPVSLIKSQCRPGCHVDYVLINQALMMIKRQMKIADSTIGLQIIQDCETHHWVTVRVLEDAEVELYDSSGVGLTKSLQDQMALMVSNPSFLVRVKSVQKQEHSFSDSGVPAIAFAVSLARNKNPDAITYRYRCDSMREHLRSCLLSGVFTDFEETTTEPVERIEAVTICCVRDDVQESI